MNNLLVKPITEMTPQEIELMQVQLTQARLSDMQKQLELVANIILLKEKLFLQQLIEEYFNF